MPEPHHSQRGRLKIYLGYAAGVGKTFQMLQEAHELALKGVDLVIGYFEPHGRQDTIAKAEGLQSVPRRKLDYRGAVFEEMDTEAILRRHPQICLVDELAHTNVPGSAHAKRWEDVLVLLEAGIDVFATLNIQHLESLNDQVWQMTGVRVRETVPDWIIRQADEVVMVDLTPRALLNRLRRGAVYAPDKARRALENFFKESTLVALRELALRETAHEVDARQLGTPEPAPQHHPPPSESGPAHQRLMVWVTPDPSAALLIRRARRVADYLRAECFAVYVRPEPDSSPPPLQRAEAIEKILNFARNLHIETRILHGSDVARALIDFARVHQVTRIFLARPRYRRWQWLLGRNLIHEIVREARDIEIIIVAERRPPKTP
jgi:two-component system sensor histidine kinase KdpD